MNSERLIGAEHLSGGDAKQERVTNVTGGASHGDFNRSLHGAISHKRFVEQRQSQRHVMSSEVETSRTLRDGFLDFAQNDTMKISGRFWMRCIRVN
jgi:hypothetical protein